jgi:glycerol kinase
MLLNFEDYVRKNTGLLVDPYFYGTKVKPLDISVDVPEY